MEESSHCGSLSLLCVLIPLLPFCFFFVSETFAKYFGKFGEVVDSVIMMDRMTGNPRGFGFVTFADPAVAEKVFEEEHIIDDRKVDIDTFRFYVGIIICSAFVSQLVS